MKAPMCPYCGYAIKRTVNVIIRGDVVYYLNRSRCGYVYPMGGSWDFWKYKKPNLIAFCCRNCLKEFPETMWKDIKKYLKQEHLLNVLKGRSE